MKPPGLLARFGRPQPDAASSQTMAAADSLLKQNGGSPPSASSGWSIGSTFSKVGEALTIEPRRTTEPDAVSLANTPSKAPLDVYLKMARISEDRGALEVAETQYRSALQYYPKDQAAAVSLARYLDRRNREREAREVYERTLQEHPKSALVHNDLGLFHARRGRLKDGLTHLERAVELAPQRELYRHNLAKTLVAAEQLERAREQLAGLAPPEVVEYNLGVLLSQLGRQAAAEERFRASLALNPQFAAARQMLPPPAAAPPGANSAYVAQRMGERAAPNSPAPQPGPQPLGASYAVPQVGPYAGDASPAATPLGGNIYSGAAAYR